MSNKKTIPRKVWWGLKANSYTEIAQELPANYEYLRRWVAIYAVYHLKFVDRYPGERYYNFLEDSKNSKFVAIEFTIPKHILETRDSIGSSDTTIIKCQTLESEEDINVFLQQNNINPELFTPPWTCEYPLD
ncbi:Phage protein [Pseudomonas sp. IT-P294]